MKPETVDASVFISASEVYYNEECGPLENLLDYKSNQIKSKYNDITSSKIVHQLVLNLQISEITVIPRYNAPRYNADLAITRFFTPKVFLPRLLRKGKFSAKLVNISL